jgi:hypothetical protein
MSPSIVFTSFSRSSADGGPDVSNGITAIGDGIDGVGETELTVGVEVGCELAAAPADGVSGRAT